MSHQYKVLEDTVYFWFASNDTSGSGGDGATPLADVRLAGAAASAVPVLSPTPTLLTDTGYPAGCYEVAVAATAANGFAATSTYAVFCTLAIDSQNPTGFVGSFSLDPVIANVVEISDDSTAANNAELAFDGTGYGFTGCTIPTTTTVTNQVTANTTQIEGVDATDQINAACDASIETYHLDHLLAADYDPAAKPGVATALFNELIESDAGVSRYTANALEQAPDTITGLSLAADQSAVTIGTVNLFAGTIGTLDALDTAQDVQHQATQDAIGQIAVGSGGVATTASGFAKDGAEPETNSYTDTATTGTLHIVEDDGGTTGFYYEFYVGTDGVPMQVDWSGYAQSNGDSYDVSFYNWDGAVYDPVETISASNATTLVSNSFQPTIAHVGTGANAGLVRLYFSSADGTALATDRIICTYTQLAGGIANGTTITLAAAATNENYIGQAWYLALGGQDISGSYFYGAINVTGTATVTNGTPGHFSLCRFGAATLSADMHLDTCRYGGTLTFTSTSGVTADDIDMIDGNSVVAGSGSPVFDFSGVTKETNINCRKYAGGSTWTLTSDCTMSLEVQEGGGQTITTGGGDVEIRGICRAVTITSSGTSTTQIIALTGPITINGTGGTVNIYGINSGVTDNSGGSVTINDDSQNDLSAAEMRTALGLATNNLDTQLGDIPTVAEMEARTLVAASYFDPAVDTVANVTEVAQIAGTIGTLDALDTAQDTQHAATQADIAALNDPTAAAIRAEIDANSTQLALIVADTNELQTDWTNGGRLDLLVDAIKAVTDNLPNSGALTDLATAANLAIVDTVVDAIKVVTDALTAASAAKLALSAGTIVSGIATSGTLSTTQMEASALTETTNDHYNGRIIIWTSGVLKDQATDITDYDGATKTFTYTAITEAPGAGDTFVIV